MLSIGPAIIVNSPQIATGVDILMNGADIMMENGFRSESANINYYDDSTRNKFIQKNNESNMLNELKKLQKFPEPAPESKVITNLKQRSENNNFQLNSNGNNSNNSLGNINERGNILITGSAGRSTLYIDGTIR
jgi:hypothetical protein